MSAFSVLYLDLMDHFKFPWFSILHVSWILLLNTLPTLYGYTHIYGSYGFCLFICGYLTSFWKQKVHSFSLTYHLNIVQVLAEEAHPLENLDRGAAQEALSKAQSQLSSAANDKVGFTRTPTSPKSCEFSSTHSCLPKTIIN